MNALPAPFLSLISRSREAPKRRKLCYVSMRPFAPKVSSKMKCHQSPVSEGQYAASDVSPTAQYDSSIRNSSPTELHGLCQVPFSTGG